MKHIIKGFLSVCCYCLAAGFVSAQEELEPLELLTSPLPIFSEQQDNGRMTGYSIDYARSVFRMAGYEPQITPLPFARLMKKIASSEGTVATGIGRTPEREDDFFWIAPMTANVIGVFSLEGGDQNGVKIDGLDKVKSVGVLRGDYRAEILRSQNASDIVEFNSWEQAIGAVLKGRVASIFFSELGVSVTCKSAGLDCSAITKIYTHDVQFSYMAILKTDQNREHAMRLSEAAEQFVYSREFSQLSARWLPQLQLMDPNVNITEGVVTLGKIERSESVANQIWVLTHLEPPFSEYDERGKPIGYAVELVQGILTEAGLRQQILAAPWQRILVESRMKSDVLVFSLARTEAREDEFHWISPITQNAYSVFANNPSALNTTVGSINELPPGSKIAVLEGDFRQQVVIDAGHVAVTGSTWQDVLKRFLQGKADYLFFSDGGIDVICLTIEQSCKNIHRVFQFKLATTYLAISKQGTSLELVDRLTSASINFKRSTQYKAMAERWLLDYRQRNMAKMHEQDGIIKLWVKTKND